jgi:hypothetical protein
MMAALGVIMLYLGSFIEVLDISMAVIASLFCIIAVIEYGGASPWMIYGVTAVLSLILLPNKTPAIFYTAFFGFYPILKEKLERLKRPIGWLLKELVFNVVLAIATVAAVKLMLAEGSMLTSPIVIGVAVVVCEAIFILYDIALTRLITFYLITLRPRLKL